MDEKKIGSGEDVVRRDCAALQERLLSQRSLIIASNRGPVTHHIDTNGEVQVSRGGGGLVTALTGLAQHVNACWIACSQTEADRDWKEGVVSLEGEGNFIRVLLISPDEPAYDQYYNVISNPLLWFLQHSMWDTARSPTIDHKTWQAWEDGYVQVNRLFAEAIARTIREGSQPALVMLQDYHLYLVPRFLRQMLPHGRRFTLSFFVHIPWPGPEDWGLLPPRMRLAILDSLTAVDLLGFQTREDGLNFIRTIESNLSQARVDFKRGRVRHRSRVTTVRDFPISIDAGALRELAGSDEVEGYRKQLRARYGDRRLIVRVDRTEPSKNILRGFQAFDEMLELHPEHSGRVQFLAFLVPSRMEVVEYQSYLDELMAAAGRVNVHHGDSEWEPVRILVGENYARAVAALQMYDVLLVNSIADGMNLVAKEGPTVNKCNGVVILSERTGARQQLEPGAIIIPPWDIFTTAEAMHQALVMKPEERIRRSALLRRLVEEDDISDWLCRQLEEIEALKL